MTDRTKTSRRDFFKTASAGALVSTLAPSILRSVEGATSTAAQSTSPISPRLLRERWDAHWITTPAATSREYGVFHFRKHVTLPQRPQRFPVHVSADNRYRLFVNGEFVADGPARGDLDHWRFETVDLAPQLKVGENLVTAVVWNYGAHLPSYQITWRTAFIIQGDTVQEAAVNSDATWKVTQNTAYTPIPGGGTDVGPFDRVDAARYPWGWQEPGFDDSSWPAAQLLDRGMPRGVGTGTRWALVPRSIPPMDRVPQRFATVRRAEGVRVPEGFLAGQAALLVPAHSQASVLLDQAVLTTAYPELVVSGGKGARITLTYAEGLFDANGQKGQRDEVEGRRIAGNRDEFLPDGGARRRFRPLWLRAFRFVEMKIATAQAPVTIHELQSELTGYPFRENGAFASDDPELQDIWRVSWRTARLCAGETYYDCPYYEQLQYVGDTRIQSLISLYVSGDDRLMRNAILHFDDSRISDGITQSRYPSSVPQLIPPFSLFWIGMIHDYWMHRDDPAFVRSLLPGVRNVLDWHARFTSPAAMLGPVPWWSFVDWPDQWPWNDACSIGGEPAGVASGDSSILTLQLALAQESAADLFAACQQPQAAAEYRLSATRLKQATRAHCWDTGRGLLADTPQKDTFSQHANLLAVLTDVVPAEQQRALLQRVLADADLIQCTLYYRFYLYRAAKKCGLGDLYVSMLDPWRKMLKLGLTTFAERPEPTRSDCHAWSASPNYDLLASVCGVEPGTPGFKSVRITPHLGPLRWVKGRVPHPLGLLEVRFERRGPSGLEGELTLPAGLSGELVWDGERVPLKPGVQTVRVGAQGGTG